MSRAACHWGGRGESGRWQASREVELLRFPPPTHPMHRAGGYGLQGLQLEGAGHTAAPSRADPPSAERHHNRGARDAERMLPDHAVALLHARGADVEPAVGHSHSGCNSLRPDQHVSWGGRRGWGRAPPPGPSAVA